MRTKLIAGIAAATLIAGSATFAYAQEQSNEQGHPRGGHMLERLTQELNLTEEQQASLRETMKENFSEMREGMGKYRSDRQAMAKLDPNAPDYQAQLDQLIANAQEAAKERVLMRAEHQKDIYALLTPEQQAQFAKMKQDRPMFDRHHGKHQKGCDK